MNTTQKIQQYYIENKMSAMKIASAMNISIGKVYYHLSKAETIMRTNKENSRRYHCNDSFFDTIDTEEKAYWLGFIYADGYITSNSLGITLSSRDKSHLEKLSISLSSDYPINTYEYSGYGNTYGSRLLIKSDLIVSDLIRHGVFYKKSLILMPPNLTDIALVMHFIRGYMDGDGSISISKTKYGDSFRLRFEGTLEVLTWLQFIFNTKCKLQKRKKDDKNSYSLDYGGNLSVLSKLNLIYNNATVFLDRKYARYKMLQSFYPEMDKMNRVNSVDNSYESIPSMIK